MSFVITCIIFIIYHLVFRIDRKQCSGIQGVQLFPEDIQVLILLFADDIALISDTIVGPLT